MIQCDQYGSTPPPGIALLFDGNDGLGLFYRGQLIDIVAGKLYPLSIGNPPPDSFNVDGFSFGTKTTIVRSVRFPELFF